MHRNSKWAQKLLELQDDEGKWGWFHTLSRFCDSPVTTEGALRRLERLGFTREDECVRRVLAYMHACLTGEKQLPDRREKRHDWDAFTRLMLAANICRLTDDDRAANAVAEQWAQVVNAACAGGEFDQTEYLGAYRRVFGKAPLGGRLEDAVSFYQASLLRKGLTPEAERTWLRYLLQRADGIYYVYEKRVAEPPERFMSREASRYIAVLELLADYKCAGECLQFAVRWLESSRLPDGSWDMGPSANDCIFFPLSDSWRRPETRIADCTERIGALHAKLTG